MLTTFMMVTTLVLVGNMAIAYLYEILLDISWQKSPLNTIVLLITV